MKLTIEEKLKITQDEYTHLMGKYLMMQADYKTRLKADMVAILEELKEQLREMHEGYFETEHYDEACGVSDSMDVIQQKINALKEDNNNDETDKSNK